MVNGETAAGVSFSLALRREPLVVFESPAQLRPWLEQHPQGRVIVYTRVQDPLQLQPAPEFAQKFKGRHVGVWRASDLMGVSDQWLESQDRRR